MTKNKILSLRYYIIDLGAPARKLAVGLSAHSPRHARKLPCLWAIRYNPWREPLPILLTFLKLSCTKYQNKTIFRKYKIIL